jgi:glyoxylate reductase
MARVFVTRAIPGDALNRLAAEHDVDVWDGHGPPEARVIRDRVATCDGLLALISDRVDASVFDAAPRLRVVSNYAAGLDNVDLAEARRRGIAVGHTPDVVTESTADLAMALLLAVARRLPEATDAVRDGAWGPFRPEWLLGTEILGSTLGIVGFGRIGQAMARRASGFGMRVVHTRARSSAAGIELEQLLRQSDFVSLHCPLTSATRSLLDARRLALMKPTAYLINTARGGIVDQAALVQAVHTGAIAGAALDVMVPEPLPVSDPLLQTPGILISPHIGSATQQTRERMSAYAVDNLIAGLRGDPMPYVSP